MNDLSSSSGPARAKRSSLAVWLALVFVILLLTAIAVPNFVKARVTASKSACINNLRQIDGAKNSWALEHKLTNGAPVLDAGINALLKGAATPLCPAGGIYSFNPVGVSPTCSLGKTLGNGHSLE